jgi:hypothetical protein
MPLLVGLAIFILGVGNLMTAWRMLALHNRVSRLEDRVG